MWRKWPNENLYACDRSQPTHQGDSWIQRAYKISRKQDDNGSEHWTAIVNHNTMCDVSFFSLPINFFPSLIDNILYLNVCVLCVCVMKSACRLWRWKNGIVQFISYASWSRFHLIAMAGNSFLTITKTDQLPNEFELNTCVQMSKYLATMWI